MSVKSAVHLFHWNQEDAVALMVKVREAGFNAVHHAKGGRLSLREIAPASAIAKHSTLWIIWRKGNRSFNGNVVREAALALGLVDYKICSLDSTWSGMLLAVKKAKPERNARS